MERRTRVSDHGDPPVLWDLARRVLPPFCALCEDSAHHKRAIRRSQENHREARGPNPEAELKKRVEQKPCQAGYAFSTWTCADLVREPVKKGFEKVGRETIRVHLHDLDYRLLRPVLSIASPNPECDRKVKLLEKYKKQVIWFSMEAIRKD